MKKNRKLIWQLYPSYLMITLASLLAVGWFTSGALRHFFLETTESSLKTQCLLLEKRITRYFTPLDAASIDKECKSSGGNAPTRITVILSDGSVVGDSEENPSKMDNHRDRPEVVSAFSGIAGSSTRYSNTLRQKMMYVAIPIIQKNGLKGILRASIPITDIDNKIKKVQTKIAWGALLVACLASIISFLVSRRISLPIEDLKQGADKFSKGDLDHRLVLPTTYELFVLAESMNHMAAELEERIKNIQTQRNEYEVVLASMIEGVIAVDSHDCILSVNQAATDILNVNASGLKGQSIQAAVRNADLHNFVKDAISTGKAKADDITIHKEDGTYIIYTRSSPLFDSGGKQMGLLLVLSDVTQLRALDSMRRDFAANVSHEIKTPLTAIKGFVETLQQGAIDNYEDATRFLGIIEKHVNRLNCIVDDLLNLSKIERMDEKAEISFAQTSIADVIETAVSLCKTCADDKNININYECDENSIARVDAYLLEQAFVNLLDNGIKYSDTGTTVNINVEDSDEKIVISFQDCGVGIAKEHLSRLFERFYRVDKARSRKMGGTGLGLAIVKHIVLAHGGKITVESEPGKGSTFYIHIPKVL